MGALDEYAYGPPWKWYRPGRFLARGRKAGQVGAALALGRLRGAPFPVTYLDVGARWGPSRAWQAAARAGLAELVLVEPDDAEAAALAGRFPSARVVRAALGPTNGSGKLHLTAEPAVSSMLEPDPDAAAALGVGENYVVDRTVEVELVRFDEVCRREELARVHFAKLDVQGYEHQVVQGFGNRVDDLLGIELEVAFQRTYRDQHLVGEVNDQLTAAGFALVDIRPLGASRAGVIEANAFYARRDVGSGADRDALMFWRLLLGVRTNAALRHGL
ncbi:MAG: methyltransferase, FkbM family domain protein [Actinomycetia bacterium]|nr:methyltransferase, FkbM family domain protein [Actinomycetes bacterium]